MKLGKRSSHINWKQPLKDEPEHKVDWEDLQAVEAHGFSVNQLQIGGIEEVSVRSVPVVRSCKEYIATNPFAFSSHRLSFTDAPTRTPT